MVVTMDYHSEYDMHYYWLYVLELENNKYYVGITKNVEHRFKEHAAGVGADYTCKFKPIRILYKENTHRVNKKQAEEIENIKTLQLMILHGVDNVRGGDFCTLNTSDIFKKIGNEVVCKMFLTRKILKTDKDFVEHALAFAKAIYASMSQHAEKEQEILQQIEDRNSKKGYAYCSVKMCVHNEHQRCKMGISPYDVDLCSRYYIVKDFKTRY